MIDQVVYLLFYKCIVNKSTKKITRTLNKIKLQYQYMPKLQNMPKITLFYK